MADHFEQTIADLQMDIARKEKELADHKRMVNYLCGKVGQPPLYADADAASQGSLGNIRRDRWYGQPMSTAIREYLAIAFTRCKSGSATVGEIHEAMKAGGFEFTDDGENAKRGLRISRLTKNRPFSIGCLMGGPTV